MVTSRFLAFLPSLWKCGAACAGYVDIISPKKSVACEEAVATTSADIRCDVGSVDARAPFPFFSASVDLLAFLIRAFGARLLVMPNYNAFSIGFSHYPFSPYDTAPLSTHFCKVLQSSAPSQDSVDNCVRLLASITFRRLRLRRFFTSAVCFSFCHATRRCLHGDQREVPLARGIFCLYISKFPDGCTRHSIQCDLLRAIQAFPTHRGFVARSHR